MTTGDNFAKFNSKGLVNYEDWDTYFMLYVRESIRKSIISRWTLDGTLDVLLTLSGIPGGVRVLGSSWQTDGNGHILDIASATTRDALFENSNGVNYYVANFYAEAPSDVRPSPRTGVIQYARMAELLGRSANPNSVVDNGNGTMTFTVDSVTEVGVTNAGRTVRVFKKIPGLNATLLSMAVEDCVVAFTGGANKITTVGIFGQSGTPSTTAADYTVICLGPAVTRNEDLRSTSGAAFVGTVTGVGGASTPVSFTTTDQRLLKSQNDATQITYTPTTPANWPNPDPTTVQEGFDKLVANLLATTPGASGAMLVALSAAANWSAIGSGGSLGGAQSIQARLDALVTLINANGMPAVLGLPALTAPYSGAPISWVASTSLQAVILALASYNNTFDAGHNIALAGQNALYNGDIGTPNATTKLRFLYFENDHRWVSVHGAGGGNPHWFQSQDDGVNWNDQGAIAATALQTIEMERDNNQNIVVGLQPTGATLSKILVGVAEGFSSWTLVAVGGSANTAGISCVHWNPTANWVLGQTDGNFQTASNPNGPWTARTGINAARIDFMAADPTGLIILAAFRGNSTTVARSTDGGATWTSVTFNGGSSNVRGLVYSKFHNKFIIFAPGDGAVWQSATGAAGTWSSVGTIGLNSSNSACALVAYKNALFAVVGSDGSISAIVYYSMDGGANWAVGWSGPSTLQSQFDGFAIGNGQLMLGAVTDGKTRASLRLGP